MFVIPCLFSKKCNLVYELVDGIRKFHPYERIVIVDSGSDDKSYFELQDIYPNIIVEDVCNKGWMVGAYWHAYNKYPDEDFYYFLHDTMRIKANIDYMKQQDLTLLFTFYRSEPFNKWSNRVTCETNIKYYNTNGFGCFGPTFMCKNHVMKKLKELGCGNIIPTDKIGVGCCEGMYGFFFEHLGYDLMKCSLHGDFTSNSINRDNTDWMFPVQKLFGHMIDKETRGDW